MEKEIINMLGEIKKELQDIRSILEPKEIKILVNEKVIYNPNQKNCY